MAGDWLVWRKGVCDKPRIKRIAAMCGVSKLHAAAAIMLVHEWLDAHVSSDDITGDGDANVTLGASPISELDVTGCTPGLGAAMVSVGWLRIEGETWVFPRFAKNNGKTAKDRVLTQIRMAKLRNNSVTKSSPKKRTEQKSITPTEETASLLPGYPPTAESEKAPDSNVKPKTPRARDLIWDALAAEFFDNAAVPRSYSARFGAVVADLKKLGATPDDIPKRVARMRDAWEGRSFAAEAVAKWWSQFATDAPPPRIGQRPPASTSGGSKRERAAARGECPEPERPLPTL